MSTLTTNYSIVKPSLTETANIEVINSNMDIIDAKIKEAYNRANTITVPVTSVNSKTGAVVLGAGDVGAVPTTRTVNNKALSGNVTLVAGDIKYVDGVTIEAYRTITENTLAKSVIKQSKIEPMEAVEGTLWLDTSDVGYQKTELDNIKTQLDKLEQFGLKIKNKDTTSQYYLKLDNNGLYLEEV